MATARDLDSDPEPQREQRHILRWITDSKDGQIAAYSERVISGALGITVFARLIRDAGGRKAVQLRHSR
jgi:hypothetical protein